MKILKIIGSIFFDGAEDILVPGFRSETEHYRKEIAELYMDEIHVMAAYKDVRHILEAYKYQSESEKGEKLLPLLLASPLLSEGKGSDICIVPVPMHWSRYMIRGYDHIALFAKGITKRTGIETRPMLQTTFSWKQAQLSKVKRIKNRASAISLKKGVKIPKEAILLDDVISTGSTANACAKVLKDA